VPGEGCREGAHDDTILFFPLVWRLLPRLPFSLSLSLSLSLSPWCLPLPSSALYALLWR
jgi:hypothetical protein